MVLWVLWWGSVFSYHLPVGSYRTSIYVCIKVSLQFKNVTVDACLFNGDWSHLVSDCWQNTYKQALQHCKIIPKQSMTSSRSTLSTSNRSSSPNSLNISAINENEVVFLSCIYLCVRACMCTFRPFIYIFNRMLLILCFTNESIWQVKFKITLCYCALNDNRAALAEVFLSLKCARLSNSFAIDLIGYSSDVWVCCDKLIIRWINICQTLKLKILYISSLLHIVWCFS